MIIFRGVQNRKKAKPFHRIIAKDYILQCCLYIGGRIDMLVCISSMDISVVSEMTLSATQQRP